MPTLAACIKKLGKTIDADDKIRLKELAAQYKADGMTKAEAEQEAVDDVISEIRATRADVVSQIKAAGGVAPTRGQVSKPVEQAKPEPTPVAVAKPDSKTTEKYKQSEQAIIDTITDNAKNMQGNYDGISMAPAASDYVSQIIEKRRKLTESEEQAIADKHGLPLNIVQLFEGNVGFGFGAVEQHALSKDSVLHESAKAFRANKPEPKPEPAKEPEAKPEPKVEPKDKIEDFGEKVGGARKDLSAYTSKLAGDIDVESVPLSKSFPEPNYEKLSADGVDHRILAFIAQIRGEIPVRAKRYGKAARADKIRTAREFASRLLTGELSIGRVIEKAAERDTYAASTGDIVSLAKDLPADRIKRLGDFKITEAHFGLFKGERDVTKWEVTDTAGKSGFGGMGNRAHFDSKEDALKHITKTVKTVEEGSNAPASRGKTKLEIYQDRKTGEVWIGKKIAARKYVELKRFEKGVKAGEARAYREEHIDELLELLKKKKTQPAMRRETNDPRIGKDYREGKDVTPDQFGETFGFRGVEFGNWVDQGKRQSDLNNAYDGLMDLAELIGIPPKAISFNGELSLAFGARGKGGKRPAAAHYEPGKVVINLTKKSGAGSLAHEWWHGLDNYFSRARNQPSSYVTDAPRVKSGRGDAATLVRPEVLSDIKSVIDAIRSTELITRSKRLDNTRAKDYWSTTIELTARAFERFVIDKAALKSEKSDYLANIQSGQYWEVQDAIEQGKVGTDEEAVSTYPYPTDEEAGVINDAFEALFNTIETKETDQGVALFSLDEEPTRLTDEGDVKLVETGKPVTFRYSHNQDSATKMFGKPDKDSPYGRGYEPSGRFVSIVSENYEPYEGSNIITGELTFRNPLVVDNDGLKWKKALSEQYGGKTGKKLSKALIKAGYDGIITTEDGRYITESVDLTTFDESKALYNIEDSLQSKSKTNQTQQDIESAISSVVDNISDTAGITVNVISAENIPANVKAQIPKGKRPKGFAIGDTVYLVHDHLSNARDAQITLAHELKGHVGVNNIIDNWDEVETTYAKLKERGGERFNDILKEVKRRNPELDNLTEIKEFIAIAAERRESEGSIGSFMRKVRESLKKALNALGFKPIGMTDIDLILSRSEAFVAEGVEAQGDFATQFSTNEDKNASWTDERIDRVIQTYASVEGTDAQIAFINPSEFVDATHLDPKAIAKAAGDLDVERLKDEKNTPFLWVVDGKIVAHEGRHRMSAMAKEGIDRVPIAIRYLDGIEEAPKASDYTLEGQELDDGDGKPLNISESYAATSENKPDIKAAMSDPNILFSLDDKPIVRDDNNPYDVAFRALGEKDKTLFQLAKRAAKREFKAGGLLPDTVFEEKITRDAAFNAVEFDVAHGLGGLDNAIKKSYGKTYHDLPMEEQDKINDSFTKVTPSSSLPQTVRVEIVKMRAEIRKLSLEYMSVLEEQIAILGNKVEYQSEMFGEKPSAEAEAKIMLLRTIEDNLDTYAHRSYRAFDDPKWPKKIPREVFDNASAYLETRYRGLGLSEREIQTRVSRTIKTITEENTAYDSMESMINESKLGAKDLSVLKKRKDIAPEIRELLGEYKDARVNFAKTMTKMSRLIYNQKFLDKLKEIGLDQGFLFTEDNKPIDESIVKIAADSSEAYAPLNGYYTYKEIDMGLKDSLGNEEMGVWFRRMIRANGLIKHGKTVLSPTTAARNWMSASFFAMANGHFDLTQMRKSVSGLREYFTHTGEAGKVAYLRKLKVLGVVYDSPYAGEMMDLLSDAQLEQSLFADGPMRKIKAAHELVVKFYQYGDDFWKILGWENEKALLMKYKGMTEAEAEVEAAERIRNTYPTYSMVGKFVKRLRRFPLAGTFVSFPSEIIRTSYHMIHNLQQDMKDSPAYASRKILGLAMASSAGFAVQAVSKGMFGMDDEEEEAVRLLSAPWNRNSNLVFLGRDEDGNLRYLDFSFLDAYNYWKRPINAILRDQPIEDALYQSAEELLKPFFGQDIGFGAIMEAVNNKKESGGRIFNPQDRTDKQVLDIADHLRVRLQAGVLGNVERLTKAVKGDVSSSGKKYDINDEMASLLGWRVTTFDPKIAVYYRSFDFKSAMRDSSGVLSKVIRDPNSVTEDELETAYRTTERSRANAQKEMIKIVSAAENSGLDKGVLFEVLRKSGISEDMSNHLVMGKVQPWHPSSKAMENIVDKSQFLLGNEKASDINDRVGFVMRLEPKDTK